jgi:hypothetical protein
MRAVWFALWLLAWLALAPASAQTHADNGMARIERLQDHIATSPEEVRQLPESAWSATAEPNQLSGAQRGGWWRLHARPTQGWHTLLVYHPYSARLIVLAPPDYRPQRKSIFDRTLDTGHSRRALTFSWSDTSQPVYIGVEDARYPLQVAVRGPRAFSVEDYGHVRVLWLSLGILIGVSLVTLLFLVRAARTRLPAVRGDDGVADDVRVAGVRDAYALPALAWLGRFGVEGIWFIATASTIVTVFFLCSNSPSCGRARRISVVRCSWWVRNCRPCCWWRCCCRRPYRGRGAGTGFPHLAMGCCSRPMRWRSSRWWWYGLRGGRDAGSVLIAWVPLVFVSTARAVQLAPAAVEPVAGSTACR